jgi:ribonuclease Z
VSRPSGTQPGSHRPELASPNTVQIYLDRLGVRLEGQSVAGVETWMRLPEWSLAIDVGRAPECVARCKHLALTHAHMDHAGGLAQYLCVRQLYAFEPPTVYAPAESCDDLRVIVDAWGKLHKRSFAWTLIGMRPGDEAPIGGGRWLRALPADHVIPALGYAVLERPHRRKPEFLDTSPNDLRALAQNGVAISEPTERVLLAVSGDTMPGVLDRVVELRTAEVVAMETTFLDARRTVADARLGGHTHLNDVLERADGIRPHVFVPYHISQIYTPGAARAILTERLPPELLARCRPLLP